MTCCARISIVLKNVFEIESDFMACTGDVQFC